MKLLPDQWKHTAVGQLIGLPASSAASLLRFALDRKCKIGSTLKLRMYGPPGCGKTTIAELIAECLAGHRTDIESVNGRNLTVDLVRQWQADARFPSLFNGWKVKIINEVDLAPPFGQEIMLSYLDEMPARTAVIATSNEGDANLTERFATRFMSVRIDPPSDAEIAEFLRLRWHIRRDAANLIAANAQGNVRDSLLRAAQYLALGSLEPRPEAGTRIPVTVAQAVALSPAEKAWVTRRGVQAVATESQN